MAELPVDSVLGGGSSGVQYDDAEEVFMLGMAPDIEEAVAELEEMRVDWYGCMDEDLEEVIRVDLDTALGVTEMEQRDLPLAQEPAIIRGLVPTAMQRILQRSVSSFPPNLENHIG